MLKYFGLTPVLAGLAFGLNAQASPVCDSIAECQDLIQQANIRIQILSGPADQRISNIGAVFTRDSSNSALGEAYRDPSGLIWGAVATTEGPNGPNFPRMYTVSQRDADQYCKNSGARLATKEDYERLKKYLGSGTAHYSRHYYDANGKIMDFLPGLGTFGVWTSTGSPHNAYSAYVFGFGVEFEENFMIRDMSYLYSVRCVAD